jgi:hypothetical protein
MHMTPQEINIGYSNASKYLLDILSNLNSFLDEKTAQKVEYYFSAEYIEKRQEAYKLIKEPDKFDPTDLDILLDNLAYILGESKKNSLRLNSTDCDYVKTAEKALVGPREAKVEFAKFSIMLVN